MEIPLPTDPADTPGNPEEVQLATSSDAQAAIKVDSLLEKQVAAAQPESVGKVEQANPEQQVEESKDVQLE